MVDVAKVLMMGHVEIEGLPLALFRWECLACQKTLQGIGAELFQEPVILPPQQRKSNRQVYMYKTCCQTCHGNRLDLGFFRILPGLEIVHYSALHGQYPLLMRTHPETSSNAKPTAGLLYAWQQESCSPYYSAHCR